MLRKITLLLSLALPTISFAQVPAIEWSRCLGGSDRESVHTILKTPDGGSLICGNTMSTDGDVTCQHDTLGWWDYWLARLDSSGNILWTQCFGGSQTEISWGATSTLDGGAILCGYAISNDGDVTGHHTGNLTDAWVVKVDYNGTLQWQKCFGGTSLDRARRIIQTSDGGYAFIGETKSNDFDVSNNHDTTWTDAWILKMDSLGTFEWSRCIGGSLYDYGYGLVQMDDGSYWATGEMGSSDFDGTGNHGYSDYFAARLDSTGNVTYIHCYGGSDQDFARGMMRSGDNLVMYGLGGSSNGDVVGHINYYDYWILCIDTSGAILWQKCLGGTGNEGAYNGYAVPGGFLFTGYTESNNVNVSGNHGDNDAWVIRTDSTGNLVWQMCLGGTVRDEGYAITPLDNGKFLTAVWALSGNGNIVGSHGDEEIWVAQLSSTYNNITGRVFYDANTNGIYDPGDKALKNKKVTETTTGRMAFTNYAGNYDLAVFSTGNFTIAPDSLPLFVPQPATQSASFFSAFGLTDTSNDFAFVPDTTPVAELEADLYNLSAFRPGFSAYYSIHCRNNGNIPMAGEITVYHDSLLVFAYSSDTPTVVAGDSLLIPIDTLQPFGERYILLRFTVDPIATIGTRIVTRVLYTPLSGDAEPTNNADTAVGIVRGSYDPNDKAASRTYIETSEVADRPEIEFVIRFQNTGNDTAFQVMVSDTLSTLLDASTLQVQANSHPMDVEYVDGDRLLKFKFPNILLPDSNVNEPLSHGFVAFSIRPYATLQAGDVIRNAANIYFDFNAPVATNAVLIPVIFPSRALDIEKGEGILVYPNPAQNEIRVRMPWKMTQCQAELFNTLGERVMVRHADGGDEIRFPIEALPPGTYFIRVSSGNLQAKGLFIKTE